MKEIKEEETMRQNIDNLLERKILILGKKAKSNPETINLPKFSLGVANEDYPAMTPHLWNSVYQALGLEIRNIRLYGDPANVGQILKAFKSDPRYMGGDIGVGFKDKAVPLLDELDSLAKEMQSINVIVKLPDGRLKGFNTDGLGYALSLEQKLQEKGQELKDKKIVMLGAGGTGNSIAFALAQKGAQLVILNRTVLKAETLCRGINDCYELVGQKKVRFGGEDQIAQEVQDADVIINVSTKGATGELEKYNPLAPAQLPATPKNILDNQQQAEAIMKLVSKQAIISDVILASKATPLMALAQKSGFATLDGIPMVINQAIEAFWLVNSHLLSQKDITKAQVAQIMKKAVGL